MAPTIRDVKRRALAAAASTANIPSSSSSTSSFVPTSTSNTAVGSQDGAALARPTKNTRHAAAANNSAYSRGANSTSGPNPSINGDVEMADEATVTENAPDGVGIPVTSQYQGPVPDDVAGDTDKEGDQEGDLEEDSEPDSDNKPEQPHLPWYRYPQTEEEKTANAIYNAVVKDYNSPFLLTTGEMTQRLEAAEIEAKAKAQEKATQLAGRANITAEAAKIAAKVKVKAKAGQRVAHANDRWKAIKRAAKAKAKAKAKGATAPPSPAITPPSPAASSKDRIPRFDRKIVSLPSRLPRALREVHNPLPPPRFGTPGGGRRLANERSTKPTENRRSLENTDRRLQFKELIKDSGSGLRVSVRADGQDGEFAPIAYRADREVMYATEDEEVFVGRDEEESFEYEYGEEDMAPFMGVMAAMGDMSIKIRQEDKGEDKVLEEEAELEDDDDGFDGDDEGFDHDAEPTEMGNTPGMQNLKRRREDEGSEGGSDDKQEQPRALKKKQRILRYYEGSDEDTPVASASRAEDNRNTINESDEPSMGFEGSDNE